MKVHIGKWKSFPFEPRRVITPLLLISGYNPNGGWKKGQKWTKENSKARDEFNDAVDRFEETLVGRLLFRLTRWYNNSSFSERKIKVHIDHWDNWDLYTTLSHVIHPALVDFRERDRQGIFWVDDEDVPEELRVGKLTEEETYSGKGYTEEKCNWVLDEMIWTFDELITEKEYSNCFTRNGEGGLKFGEPDSDGNCQVLSTGINIDKERMKARGERLENGLRLFGKYFQALWT